MISSNLITNRTTSHFTYETAQINQQCKLKNLSQIYLTKLIYLCKLWIQLLKLNCLPDMLRTALSLPLYLCSRFDMARTFLYQYRRSNLSGISLYKTFTNSKVVIMMFSAYAIVTSREVILARYLYNHLRNYTKILYANAPLPTTLN